MIKVTAYIVIEIFILLYPEKLRAAYSQIANDKVDSPNSTPKLTFRYKRPPPMSSPLPIPCLTPREDPSPEGLPTAALCSPRRRRWLSQEHA